MKIQENYFYKLDNLKEVKVIWKKYDKANILEIGVEYPTAIVDLDRFSGIKITEEWLLKFGFIKRYEDCYELGQLILNDKFIMMDIDITIKLEHVHQLQNLYYTLFGKELVISNAVS